MFKKLIVSTAAVFAFAGIGNSDMLVDIGAYVGWPSKYFPKVQRNQQVDYDMGSLEGRVGFEFGRLRVYPAKLRLSYYDGDFKLLTYSISSGLQFDILKIPAGNKEISIYPTVAIGIGNSHGFVPDNLLGSKAPMGLWEFGGGVMIFKNDNYYFIELVQEHNSSIPDKFDKGLNTTKLYLGFGQRF